MSLQLGVIGGTNLYRWGRKEGKNAEPPRTPYGAPSSPVLYVDVAGESVPIIVRHGLDHSIPPHRVNHAANLWALKAVGVTKVIGISSVGSLRREIRPPTVLIPDDYFSPFVVPTIHDRKIVHITPQLDEELRKLILNAAEKAEVEYHPRGVYVQTVGPRLETKAEIMVIKNWGEVVGMSMASEATLAQEMGLHYASICSVDNYANGIAEENLSFERILEVAAENWNMVRRVLEELVELLKG